MTAPVSITSALDTALWANIFLYVVSLSVVDKSDMILRYYLIHVIFNVCDANKTSLLLYATIFKNGILTCVLKLQ